MRFSDTPQTAFVRKLLEDKRAEGYISQFTGDRRYGHLISDVLDAVDAKPEIAECRRDTIVRAVARAASWNLKIGKTAYLFPRESPTGRGKPHLMAMQGYTGKIELMVRFRMVTFVNAKVIYANERFEHQEGTHPDIKHLPILREAERGPISGSYAWTLEPRSLVKQIAVMPVEETDRIRQEFSVDWKSVALETIPWYLIARAVHRLAKMIPMSPVAARTLNDDADDGAWREYLDLRKAS